MIGLMYALFSMFVAWPVAAALLKRQGFDREGSIALGLVATCLWPLALLALLPWLATRTPLARSEDERRQIMQRKMEEQAAELDRLRTLAKDMKLPWVEDGRR